MGDLWYKKVTPKRKAFLDSNNHQLSENVYVKNFDKKYCHISMDTNHSNVYVCK